ncbi:hypothetical protein C8F04DRAFT_1387727 [Mycena alexandri]|uniref:DUF6533 domain-containing protein n=1 Tax=Mycena alexandri TaxID=1745969 RepID=A0AAD6XFF5_9AGAR|nr:hypothetical protein C8F04DRAFT_1387727 [Mycena alexandri]
MLVPRTAMDGDSSGAQTIRFQNYCHLLGISFLIWDHLITLDEEWHFLWCRTKSTSTYWFFALRYGALAANIPVLVFSFITLPYKVGSHYTLAHQVFMLVTQLVVSAIMILRVYALYTRNKRVLGWLLGIATCFTAITVWSLQQGQEGFPITVFSGCHLGIIQSASYHLAISWACLFAFDSIIFGLTIYNAYQTRRHMGHVNMPIHRLIVRDGAMYFGAMALANLTNIITFLVRVSSPLSSRVDLFTQIQVGGIGIPGSLATFATCMSVTCMTRLMLNLHQRAEYGVLSVVNMDNFQGELDAVASADQSLADTSPILPL